MTATEKFNLVRRACHEKKVCEVKYADKRASRNIHPLGICLTGARSLVIVCCTADNFDSLQNYNLTVTNLPMEDCDHIRMLEQEFSIFPEFVANSKICEEWIFHI